MFITVNDVKYPKGFLLDVYPPLNYYESGETVRTYQVIAELYDIETSEIVWSGENMDIKKYMKRSSVRW